MLKTRWITLTIALVLLFTNAAFALTDAELETAARAFVPEKAMLAERERDDGFWEFTFYLDAEEYDVKLLPDTGALHKLDYENDALRGSKEATLTEAAALEALKALFADAELVSQRTVRDDGLYEIEMIFTTPLYRGEIDLNAETGEVLSCELIAVK